LCSLSAIYTTTFSRVSSPTPSIICLDGNLETFERFTQENSETTVTPDNLAHLY
jgi:hypothetical protein